MGDIFLKPYNGIVQDGKLTVRKNEDREKHDRLMLKDTSLHQAYVCLHCEKTKCLGTDRCFGKEAKKRE